MAIGFLRPVGASSDVKELEYVSAIHQTDLKGVRADGSIRGELKHQFSSRYTEILFLRDLSGMHFLQTKTSFTFCYQGME
jgi:hypothetical protein